MTDNKLDLQDEARQLARQLFGNDDKKCAAFAARLVDVCNRARDKEFLLIHNPGGWGSTPVSNLLKWERSIVDGVTATIEQMGYKWLLTQYFRNGHGSWAHLQDLREEGRFFFKGRSSKVAVMAAELRFITDHLKTLKVLLIAASQGAAFSNAVLREAGELPRVYSIELGIFFAHMSRRAITPRTLAIDSNGVMPDPMANRNLKAGFQAYLLAPFRWVKYQLQGRPEKFSYCVNAPGHNYDWKYPEVRRQITEFLNLNFGDRNNGNKRNLEVVLNEAGEIH